ncbi:MAG: SPFH domain-containing protein [Lewinellaceae bacterium]|nr:SPFH domain-containing protein [Lewinellaceae bacterium]
MKKYFALLLLAALFTVACKKEKNAASGQAIVYHDQVAPLTFTKIRLGDGVPLALDISFRWKVADPQVFFRQFPTEEQYAQGILLPRATEILRRVSNNYESVDSVFFTQRERYIAQLKAALLEEASEPGVLMKEVILSNIIFPATFTQAMEKTGLRQQELTRIEQQNAIDIAAADAERKKARADYHGKVVVSLEVKRKAGCAGHQSPDRKRAAARVNLPKRKPKRRSLNAKQREKRKSNACWLKPTWRNNGISNNWNWKKNANACRSSWNDRKKWLG